MQTTTEIRITRRQLKKLNDDTAKSAEAINLIYVCDAEAGIQRIKKSKGFTYRYQNKTITDKAILQRIKSLVIPPGWKNVWICAKENGHLQATGLDALNRKQYKYHPLWTALRNHTKFYHLYEFGKRLPDIRNKIQEHLRMHGLPLNKVLAALVSIMQCTYIRVGNAAYEKLYGSFGLTTLKDRHVDINGSKLKFCFKGKKGIKHDITLKNKRLARIVQQSKDIPGQELFQYYTETGEHKRIDSGMLNNYIKEISGGNFTAKDFRTWAGTLHALEAFKDLGPADSITDAKKKIVSALDTVSLHLGNTRAVCRKYYVHPAVIDLYSNNTLNKYLDKIETTGCDERITLSGEEQILMQILEQYGSAIIV